MIILNRLKFQSYVTYNPTNKHLYVLGANDAAAIPVTKVFLMLEGITFDK